tara:strand:+ start:67354 stop:67725 length:372 start_codon:yes stop_codon:yes gene_type:complete
MNTTKTYKFGDYTFKTYWKTAGEGWEIGLTCGNKVYFVGNFIREKEAKKWWSYFNKYVTHFFRKYEYYADAPKDFYGQFMGTFVYREYYNFLFELFDGYTGHYEKENAKFFKKYEKFARLYAA